MKADVEQLIAPIIAKVEVAGVNRYKPELIKA
jgi:hypothetical protein